MKEFTSIKGFEGKYKISKNGRIFSSITKRILSPKKTHKGYEEVTLVKDGNKHHKKIHRLVAKTFVQNPENKKQVNHKNGIKDDNRAINLEWVTCKENINHAYKNGLVDLETRSNKGVDNGRSKIKESDVIDIRNTYRLGCFTQKEIASAYNISDGQVSNIITRKSWAHV